jgi:hypothetical protein
LPWPGENLAHAQSVPVAFRALMDSPGIAGTSSDPNSIESGSAFINGGSCGRMVTQLLITK